MSKIECLVFKLHQINTKVLCCYFVLKTCCWERATPAFVPAATETCQSLKLCMIGWLDTADSQCIWIWVTMCVCLCWSISELATCLRCIFLSSIAFNMFWDRLQTRLTPTKSKHIRQRINRKISIQDSLICQNYPSKLITQCLVMQPSNRQLAAVSG